MEQDFKYVLQDFSHVYIGARLTYEEMTAKEDSPGRLNSAVFSYIVPEGAFQTRICDHILQMKEGSPSYLVYAQMKAQMKLVTPQTRLDKKGNEITEYKTEVLLVSDFLKDEAKRAKVTPEQITEIVCSKLHLMGLHV